MIDPRLMDMVIRLRGRGIFDVRVLRGAEQVARRHFVGDGFWEKAYDERSLPIACGQTISEPLTIAMMTQALDAGETHKILEIGTGSGYHAGILSRIGRRVYSIERYHQLLTEAEARFEKLGLVNIVTRHGDGRYGWKGQAPFDRIIATCALKSVPKALLEQLAEGGILVAVIKGELMRFSKQGGSIRQDTILPLDLPIVESGKSQVL